MTLLPCAGGCQRLDTTGATDRHELLFTHNFVIGWFVRHMFEGPVWRWIGLNQANCAITIVEWESDRPPTLVSFNEPGHL
jgi:serine/threonine-protein phosphatase PGAM5